jgi:AICAR transformylase/IMP cyclohydrolase PurH
MRNVPFFLQQHKNELLTSIRDLARMGYKLFASMGTADFYTENGIKVSFFLISLNHFILHLFL